MFTACRRKSNLRRLKMKKVRFGAALLAASSVLALGSFLYVAGGAPAFAENENAAQLNNNLHAAAVNTLKPSRFKDVKVSVKDGVVTLTGTVKNFAVKQDANKRVQRLKNLEGVHNMIQVEGAGTISDEQLEKTLVKQIATDRVGYGQAFNAISVRVQNGVAILGGHALGPVAKESAVGLASTTKGVQDVIDNIEVDPVSPMDNEIRIRVYRAVYGFPTLNKYALNPAQPIRITVVNGNVLLNGVVDSQADKDAAGIRANGVPGVFKVTNDLQVASESKKK